MSSSNVITTEQIEEGQAWIQAFYDGYESSTFDAEHWVNEFCQPDAILYYTSQLTVRGHKEIVAFAEEDHKQQTAKPVIKHIDVLLDRIYVRLDAIFIQKNDPEQKEIIIKGLVLFWKKIDENKASSIECFFDPTPLIEKKQNAVIE